jgi:hypothetical protein
VLDVLAGGGARLAADRLQLVDLVDEDDAAPGLLDVAAGAFEQALEDGVEFLVDVFGLRQRSRVGGDEGQFEDAQSSVLPVPVGPINRMLLFSISSLSTSRIATLRKCA